MISVKCIKCGKIRFFSCRAEEKRRNKTGLCKTCFLKSLLETQPGEHHSWKGGKTIRDGYVFIRNTKHPFCNNVGYVREHRLVMENKLGRLLKPNEIVHHINGIRDDNRIENLVLVSSQLQHMHLHPKEPVKCLICSGKHLARGFCKKHYREHMFKTFGKRY